MRGRAIRRVLKSNAAVLCIYGAFGLVLEIYSRFRHGNPSDAPNIAFAAGAAGFVIGMLLWWPLVIPIYSVAGWLSGPAAQLDRAKNRTRITFYAIAVCWLLVLITAIDYVNVTSSHSSAWTWMLSGMALAPAVRVPRMFRDANSVYRGIEQNAKTLPRAAFSLAIPFAPLPERRARRELTSRLQQYLRKHLITARIG
jgi:hypothetical protein